MRGNMLLVLVTVLASFFIAGCSQRADNGIVTLSVIAWGNEQMDKDLREIAWAFERAHPNIKVDVDVTHYDRMYEKLMISTAGGRPPDVTYVSSRWFHPLAAKGLFQDLSPFVKEDKSFDIGDFFPEALEGWATHRGVLYGIPGVIDISATYYNKDMFDKYHVPYPHWSWDWQDHLEAARKLTKDLDGDGRIDQWGTAVDGNWCSYVYANGGTVVSEDLSHCTLTEKAAYDGIQWAADLINKYHVSPSADDTAQIGIRNLFTNGKIGMYFSGPYEAGGEFSLRLKDFTYDVGPYPKGKIRASFFGGGAISMLKGSRHKKEAWELVKWLSSYDAEKRLVLMFQLLPAHKSLVPTYLGFTTPPAHRQVFVDMVRFGRASIPVSVSQEMDEIMTAEISMVMLGRESAKTACEKLAPKIDQLLRHQEEVTSE